MLNLKREYDRLKTFSNLNIEDRKAQKFAKSGFFYTNLKDYVKCYFCALEVNAFNTPSDIEAEHLRLSPTCVYVNGEDVCGPFNRPSVKSSSSKSHNHIFNLMKPIAAVVIALGFAYYIHQNCNGFIKHCELHTF